MKPAEPETIIYLKFGKGMLKNVRLSTRYSIFELRAPSKYLNSAHCFSSLTASSNMQKVLIPICKTKMLCLNDKSYIF